MGVEEVRVFDGDVPMLFVKPVVKRRGFCPTLDEHDEAMSEPRGWETRERVLCEQKVYAGQKAEAQETLLKSFLRIVGERNGKEKV